ncbi:hypothetical protein [Bdellovibrio sp. HCB337]|uniref:hypothetical protein n=1 Tax=Bdellovibrio sp. HCB337 TaxID=3394358 RepID=UPI0039A59EB5
MPRWMHGHWFEVRKQWLGASIVPVTWQGYALIAIAFASGFISNFSEYFSFFSSRDVENASLTFFVSIVVLILAKTKFERLT